MFSDDLRWRCVSLVYLYNLEIAFISELFGPTPRTIQYWYRLFLRTGDVRPQRNPPPKNSRGKDSRGLRWPDQVLEAVKKYVDGHPTFYLEELQQFLRENFPDLKNTSASTICRALNFDLLLTRKKLTKAAREAVPEEIENYYEEMFPIYSFPEQVVFIDETSKDGRDAFRRYARSKKGTKAVMRIPFSRGNRVSAFAALDHKGFMSWKCIEGTFDRAKFMEAFSEKVVPHLNPWPLPRSIVVMDNAKIHCCKELEDAIHQCGARLGFLPPYCPELNSIEVCFGQLKRWIQKHANLIFPLYPEDVLNVEIRACTRDVDDRTVGLYGHCG